MTQDPARIPDFLSQLAMKGQAHVVLGAGQGIGEQTAHALAQQGARVLCVDLDAARAENVARAVGGEHLAADVTRRDEMARIFAEADRLFGPSLCGVADVVGMVTGRPLPDMDDSHWKHQFDMVFTHAHLALQHAAPLLARNGGGSMVFVSSIAGLGARKGGMLAYGVAKAALNHLVRSAAQQWAPVRIRVNAVAPGLTRTPRLLDTQDDAFWSARAREIPMGRPAESSDIASAILFFASGLARHVTGNILPVDGGSHDLGESPYVPALAAPAPPPGIDSPNPEAAPC
jgi:NAD(P)-dependent dehydrogenase (short-subunit alcohol dehydrogenase family)